jgi:hypothetical protein
MLLQEGRNGFQASRMGRKLSNQARTGIARPRRTPFVGI